MNKLEEAKKILEDIGMPIKQQNDLCAYTLLALLNVKNDDNWDMAKNEYIRIHDIMEFIKNNYNITYAENSRETFRKQALHHYRISALIVDNGMATNSPNYRYRITDEALKLIQSYKSINWNKNLTKY